MNCFDPNEYLDFVALSSIFPSVILNPIAYGGGGGFLSHTTIVLAATLKPLKLWLPNFVTSCFYLFATI